LLCTYWIISFDLGGNIIYSEIVGSIFPFTIGGNIKLSFDPAGNISWPCSWQHYLTLTCCGNIFNLSLKNDQI